MEQSIESNFFKKSSTSNFFKIASTAYPSPIFKILRLKKKKHDFSVNPVNLGMGTSTLMM